MRSRLSWKLALVTTVGVALVLATYSFTRLRREASLFQRDMGRDHAVLGGALALAARSVAERSGPEVAVAMLEDTGEGTPRAQIGWRPAEAGVLARSAQELTSEIEIQANGKRAMVSRQPLDLAAGFHGWIEIREPLIEEDAYLRQTLLRTLYVTLGLVALCFAVISAAGWWLLRRPLGRLVEKVERVGRGDLGEPIVLQQVDEIGLLADALNTMCERLEELQKKNEAELEARIAVTEQLRHADRLNTVGKLASGIAHELGTPLNVISARAKMIARGRSKGTEAEEDAQVVVEQAERMTRIIRQILDFARVRKPRKRPERLHAFCDRSIRLLEPLAERSKVALILEPGGEDRVAEIDEGQMQQVLTNLVMNAIHAQPDGGEVRLSIGPAPTPGEHRLLIEDKGGGIPADLREKIFEPFFTTKEVGHGTGLGLSIAYEIVREHGGRIEVDGEPGVGARFAIDLAEGALAPEER